VIRRETQTPTYWHNFQVTSADLEYITNRLIESEQPCLLEDLAHALVQYRCKREEDLIKRELAKGELFQPRRTYEVGQTLVFPALGYATGEIIHIRPGNNPEYGPFRVASVRFEGQKKEREFAIELQTPHRLNYDGEALAEDGLLTPDELYELHGAPVRETLTAYLEQSDEFVRLAGHWFLKELLLEVNEGHLNLAEAVLDMMDGGPLSTEVFLKDLDLPAQVDEKLRVFSLNYALSQDKRFDEVGPAGQILWFLRAREPDPVLNPPQRLIPAAEPYERNSLDTSLLLLQQELEDEWADSSGNPPNANTFATLTLTFPHWRVGTLPLTPRLKSIFPMGRTHRIRFLFKDSTTGATWPGWVVHRQRYVFGLKKWYTENSIPVGAYIEVRTSVEPGVVEIDFRRRRPTREWVRVAVPRDGRLNFEMRKQLVGCEYDELMVLAVDDSEGVEAVWQQTEEKGIPLAKLLYHIFPELAKLNPQGTVHAKTIYSAVNVIRRLPPGPIFATLMQDMAFLPVGDNYWLFTKSSTS
jgi:hypothetical protein